MQLQRDVMQNGTVQYTVYGVQALCSAAKYSIQCMVMQYSSVQITDEIQHSISEIGHRRREWYIALK